MLVLTLFTFGYIPAFVSVELQKLFPNFFLFLCNNDKCWSNEFVKFYIQSSNSWVIYLSLAPDGRPELGELGVVHNTVAILVRLW